MTVTEEGQDEYEDDGFIVGDFEAEEEYNDDAEERKRKKKLRGSEKSYVLDEDDYELIRESSVSKKFKRLKKAQGATSEEHSGLCDETGRRSRKADDKLNRSLVGDDDDIAEEQQEEEEDDEMADFIDHVDEHGLPLRRKRVNNKIFIEAGISSMAHQESRAIFGNDKSYRQNEYSTEKRERRLQDFLDPSVISEKYMTEKDDLIRDRDIPERMQESDESTGYPSSDGIETESSWIFNQLPHHLLPVPKKEVEEDFKRDIAKFLDLMHVQKLEVPFIAMYRKDDCPSLLKDPGQHDPNNSDKKPSLRWHKILWAIQDLDKRWLLLQKRKTALESFYRKRYEEESRREYHEARLNMNRSLFESITVSLKAAESEREVDDVNSKFNLHFPAGEVGADEGQFKRPKKKKCFYSTCDKAGLWEVASKFGYSSEQFGVWISSKNLRVEELEDAKETPEEIASNFTCSLFETPQAVLKGARHMAAVQISFEPSVRKHVRGISMDNATVSTKPTLAGVSAIDDEFHKYLKVKWLKDKPLAELEDKQYHLIQEAEEENLLEVEIKLPNVTKLISDSSNYYHSDSKSAQLWNEQRKQIIEDAVNKFLLPSMVKEARAHLASKVRSWLHREYGKHLWERVSVAPYQQKDNNSSDEEASPRVMACCWGPGKPATTFVMLDSSGEFLDSLCAASLGFSGQSVMDQQKKKDQLQVFEFMKDHQPHVVVLGAVNLSCTILMNDIIEIINMAEEHPNLKIVFGDESLPHLYENSRVSNDQLPEQSGIVKRAVALGRYMQNPLAMVATLCGPGREILSWKLTPLDSYLTPDEKYAMVEQVMVDVTNQVGLDVNLAARHEWLFAPLQFISGLGPRKAASLQKSLVRAGVIYTRNLLTTHGLGEKVFLNAGGFLRVRCSGIAAISSGKFEFLDDTRINPESYILARDLKKDKNAHENLQGKNETLNDIRLELMHGFQDWRRPYQKPSLDDIFYLISGEPVDALSKGRLVRATVCTVTPGRATCVLDSELTAILDRKNCPKDWKDLTKKLRVGNTLSCRIKSIQRTQYQVFLSCKESYMYNNSHLKKREMDPYYYEDRSSLQKMRKSVCKEGIAKQKLILRNIFHPWFQNIDVDEAIEFLSVKDPGQSIVRPCIHGPFFLTLTLKIYDGVYSHIDIVEEDKNMMILPQLGKKLKIADDTFEDLDEVKDRYVDPLVTHLKAMLDHPKFRKGTELEVDELLRKEKSEIPNGIVYSFGICHKHPGTFILTYMRGSNPHQEHIVLYVKGFKYCGRMFDDMDCLVSYIKERVYDPPRSVKCGIRARW